MPRDLLREFIRSALSEVDVLPPEKDPRQAKPPTGPAPAAPTTKASAGAAYASKEKTRGKLQKYVTDRVKSGEIRSDDDLASVFSDEDNLRKTVGLEDDEDVNLASTALRAVPLDVWKQLR